MKQFVSRKIDSFFITWHNNPSILCIQNRINIVNIIRIWKDSCINCQINDSSININIKKTFCYFYPKEKFQNGKKSFFLKFKKKVFFKKKVIYKFRVFEKRVNAKCLKITLRKRKTLLKFEKDFESFPQVKSGDLCLIQTLNE